MAPARSLGTVGVRNFGRRILAPLVTALLLTAPFAGAIVAIRYAPPAQVEIAGEPVSVRPVIGQDTTQLQHGAIVRPEHAHIGVLNKNIGLDIEADWNRLIPSDRPTRAYLVAMWDDPRPEMARIRNAAQDHLVKWSVIGFGSVAVAVCGTLLLLLQRRRRLAGYAPDEARLVDRHNRRLRWVATGVAVATIVAMDTVATTTWLHDDRHAVQGSPVFAGTNLEGTEIDGLISKILPFLSILRPRNPFYDTVAQNLEKAIADQPELTAASDDVVFVVAEDFEDVNGMARQVGLTARLIGADFIALSGDLTFAGKAIESYLIDTVDYYSDDLPVYFAPGLHDTPTIVQAAKARGWHVADGTTQEVNGISLLSVADPRISTVGDFGSGDILRDPEVSTERFVSQTITEACDTHPDFVLMHDHVLGERIAQAGCQTQAVLDGRSYQFVGPQPRTTTSGLPTTEFTSGSAGGHVSTDPDPGPIKNPAHYVALRVNPDTGETHYVVFTVRPNASVDVTPPISLQVTYDEFLKTGRTEPDPVAGSASAQGPQGSPSPSSSAVP